MGKHVLILDRAMFKKGFVEDLAEDALDDGDDLSSDRQLPAELLLQVRRR